MDKKEVKIRIKTNVLKEQTKLWRLARYLGIVTGLLYWFSGCFIAPSFLVDPLNMVYLLGMGVGGFFLARGCFKAGYIIEERIVKIATSEETEKVIKITKRKKDEK